MSAHECPREREIMELVTTSQWPAHCSDNLRLHLLDCAVCKDLVDVLLPLHNEYEELSLAADVPSAGLVWWRAELSARQEALRTVSRPLTLVEAFGGACTVGVAIALLS